VLADPENIRRQEEILQSNHEILKIYQLITGEIMQRHHPDAITSQDNKEAEPDNITS